MRQAGFVAASTPGAQYPEAFVSERRPPGRFQAPPASQPPVGDPLGFLRKIRRVGGLRQGRARGRGDCRRETRMAGFSVAGAN